ncbi:MAG TPA: SNF2-related protein, partial [Elusimicrobiota bacterium]|nr:SNF2-related protein [Elusimicrobiota bacterium]
TSIRAAFVEGYLDPETREEYAEALAWLKQVHPTLEDQLTFGGELLEKIHLLEGLGLTPQQIAATEFKQAEIKAVVRQKAEGRISKAVKAALDELEKSNFALWLKLTNNGKYLGREISEDKVKKALGDTKVRRAARVASRVAESLSAGLEAAAGLSGAAEVVKRVNRRTPKKKAAEPKKETAPRKVKTAETPAPVVSTPVKPEQTAETPAMDVSAPVEVVAEQEPAAQPRKRTKAAKTVKAPTAPTITSPGTAAEPALSPINRSVFMAVSQMDDGIQVIAHDQVLKDLEARVQARLKELPKNQSPGTVKTVLKLFYAVALLHEVLASAGLPHEQIVQAGFDLENFTPQKGVTVKSLIDAAKTLLSPETAAPEETVPSETATEETPAEAEALVEAQPEQAAPAQIKTKSFASHKRAGNEVTVMVHKDVKMDAAARTRLILHEVLASAGLSHKAIDAAGFSADGNAATQGKDSQELIALAKTLMTQAGKKAADVSFFGDEFIENVWAPVLNALFLLKGSKARTWKSFLSSLKKLGFANADKLDKARSVNAFLKLLSFDTLPLDVTQLVLKRVGFNLAEIEDFVELKILQEIEQELGVKVKVQVVKGKPAAAKPVKAEKPAVVKKEAPAAAKPAEDPWAAMAVERIPTVDEMYAAKMARKTAEAVFAFLQAQQGPVTLAHVRDAQLGVGPKTLAKLQPLVKKAEAPKAVEKKPEAKPKKVAPKKTPTAAPSIDDQIAKLDAQITDKESELAELRDRQETLEETLQELQDRRWEMEKAAEGGSAFTPLFKKIDVVRGAPEMPVMVTKDGTMLVPEFLMEKWREQEKLAPKDADGKPAKGYSLKERLVRELLQQDFKTRLALKLQELGPTATPAEREKAAQGILQNHPVQQISPVLLGVVPAQAASNEDEALKMARVILRDFYKYGSSLAGVQILAPHQEQVELIRATLKKTLTRPAVKKALQETLEEQKAKKLAKELEVPGGKAGADPRPKMTSGGAKGAYTKLLNTIAAIETMLKSVDSDPNLDDMGKIAKNVAVTFADYLGRREAAELLMISLVNDFADPLRALAGKRIRVGYYARAETTPDDQKGYFRYTFTVSDRQTMHRSQAGRTAVSLRVEEELHISPIEGELRREETLTDVPRTLYPEWFDWSNLEVEENGVWKRVQLEALPGTNARALKEYKGLRTILELQGRGIWFNTRIFGNHSLLMRMEVANLLVGQPVLGKVHDLLSLGREWFYDPKLLRAVDWTAKGNTAVFKALAAALGVKADTVEDLAEKIGEALVPVILPQDLYEKLAALIPIETERGELKSKKAPEKKFEEALAEYGKTGAKTTAPAASKDDQKKLADAVRAKEQESDDLQAELAEAQAELDSLKSQRQQLVSARKKDVSAFGPAIFEQQVWLPILGALSQILKANDEVRRSLVESLRRLNLNAAADALDKDLAPEALNQALRFDQLPFEIVRTVLDIVGYEILSLGAAEKTLEDVRKQIERALGMKIAVGLVRTKQFAAETPTAKTESVELVAPAVEEKTPKTEETTPTAPETLPAADAQPLNINDATVEQLAAVLKQTRAVVAYNKVAERIYAHVREKGALTSAQDLIDAHLGIGQKALEKLAQAIRFGSATTPEQPVEPVEEVPETAQPPAEEPAAEETVIGPLGDLIDKLTGRTPTPFATPESLKGREKKIYEAVWSVLPEEFVSSPALMDSIVPLTQLIGALLKPEYPKLSQVELNAIVAKMVEMGARKAEPPAVMSAEEAKKIMRTAVLRLAMNIQMRLNTVKDAAQKDLASQKISRGLRGYMEKYYSQLLLQDSQAENPVEKILARMQADTASKGMPELLRDAIRQLHDEWAAAAKFGMEQLQGVNPKTKPSLFQLIGIRRLIANRRTLLADVMGTGKTLQVLLSIMNSPDIQDTLIVAPLGGIETWVDEIIKRLKGPRDIVVLASDYQRIPSADDYTVTHHSGEEAAKFVDQWIAELESGKTTGRKKFVMINYDQLKILEERRPGILERLKPHGLVIDEAHNIKNIKETVIRTQLIQKIQSSYLALVTGTPIENVAQDAEIYLTMIFRDPQIEARVFADSSFENFREFWAAFRKRSTQPAMLAELNRIMNAVMVRRESEDVLIGLPAKVETNYILNLENATLEQWDGDRLVETSPLAAGKEAFDVQVHLIQWLMGHTWTKTGRRLNTEDPALDLSKIWTPEEFQKWNAFFEQQLATNKKFAAALPKDNAISLLTRVNQAFNDPELMGLKADSIKFAALKAIIEAKLKKGEQVIIYSNYTTITKKIKALFSPKLVSYVDGSVPMTKRFDQIRRFQNGDSRLFLATVDAASEAIDLSRASAVLFFDKPWKPSTVSQGATRPYRWGNKNATLEFGTLAVRWGQTDDSASTTLLRALGRPAKGTDAYVEQILHEKRLEERHTLQSGLPIEWPHRPDAAAASAERVAARSISPQGQAGAPAMTLEDLRQKVEIVRIDKTMDWKKAKLEVDAVRRSHVGREFLVNSIKANFVGRWNISLILRDKENGDIIGYVVGVPRGKRKELQTLYPDMDSRTTLFVEEAVHTRMPPEIRELAPQLLDEELAKLAQSLGYKQIVRISKEAAESSPLVTSAPEQVSTAVQTQALIEDFWATFKEVMSLAAVNAMVRREAEVSLRRIGYGNLADLLSAGEKTVEELQSLVDISQLSQEVLFRVKEIAGFKRILRVEEGSEAIEDKLVREQINPYFYENGRSYLSEGKNFDALRSFMATLELRPAETTLWLALADTLYALGLKRSLKTASKLAFGENPLPATPEELRGIFDGLLAELGEKYPTEPAVDLLGYAAGPAFDELSQREDLTAEETAALVEVTQLRQGKKDIQQIISYNELVTIKEIPVDVALRVYSYINARRRVGKPVTSLGALIDLEGMTAPRLLKLMELFYVPGAELEDAMWRVRYEKDQAKAKYAEAEGAENLQRRQAFEAAKGELRRLLALNGVVSAVQNRSLRERRGALGRAFDHLFGVLVKADPVVNTVKAALGLAAEKKQPLVLLPEETAERFAELQDELAPLTDHYRTLRETYVLKNNYRLSTADLRALTAELEKPVPLTLRDGTTVERSLIDRLEDLAKAYPEISLELMEMLDVVLFYAYQQGTTPSPDAVSKLTEFSRAVMDYQKKAAPAKAAPELPEFHKESKPANTSYSDALIADQEEVGLVKLSKAMEKEWGQVKLLIIDRLAGKNVPKDILAMLKTAKFKREAKEPKPWSAVVGGRIAWAGAYVTEDRRLYIRGHFLQALSKEELADLIANTLLASMEETAAPAQQPAAT